MSEPTCSLIVGVTGDTRPDRAERTITTADGIDFPACGMHAMRHKPSDGYGNRPIDEPKPA